MRYFPKQKFVDEKYASSFSDLTMRIQRIRCVPAVHNVLWIAMRQFAVYDLIMLMTVKGLNRYSSGLILRHFSSHELTIEDSKYVFMRIAELNLN